MKKTLFLFLAAVLAVGAISPAMAVVLDFEDLLGDGPMPDPYQGIIDWENDVWFHYDTEQFPYTPHSGSQRIYEYTMDYTPSWSFSTPVYFSGAWFSGFSYATVQMDLYYLGALVHSTGTLAPTDVPAFLAGGYAGLVDAVIINTPEPDLWVMDDLTYNPVPLPGAVWLLGSGLLALAGRRFIK